MSNDEYELIAPVAEGDRTIERVTIETDDGVTVQYTERQRKESRAVVDRLYFRERRVVK